MELLVTQSSICCYLKFLIEFLILDFLLRISGVREMMLSPFPAHFSLSHWMMEHVHFQNGNMEKPRLEFYSKILT